MLHSKVFHVAHILFDGMVDAPDTLGKIMGPQSFQDLRESRGLEHDGLVFSEKVDDTNLHIAQQHRFAWNHDFDLRAFSDNAWWNHPTLDF